MSSYSETRPKLWTPEVLADYLGVPVSWVYKRTRKKNAPETIPHTKLGKYIRFDPGSVAFRNWLASHEKAPGALTDAPNVHKFAATEKAGHVG